MVLGPRTLTLTLTLTLTPTLPLWRISAWMVLGPLGVWTSRYGRSLGAWFKIHQYSLGAASLFTFIGFWIAVTMGAQDGVHWVSFHAKLGLFFFLVRLHAASP